MFFLLLLLIPLNVLAVNSSAYSTVVMDLDSGRILYSDNKDEKRLIASVTKVLTALIVIENNDLNKEVIVGEEILKMYGTNIYLEMGEKIKVKDLLYGLLLRSGNDASMTLAVNTSKTIDDFVNLMNYKAKDIGMKNSHFANPHGLNDDTKNYSTAYDLALLSKYAYKNSTYRKITATKKYTISTGDKTYLWYNRNKLLTDYKYCTGGKNGYTPEAGKTLMTTASKDKLNLTIVTLKDSDPVNNHKNLYEYFYNVYKNYTIIDKNNFYIDREFYNKELYLKESFTYPLTKEETEYISTKIIIDNKKYSSNQVGIINIYLKDKKIGTIKIYSKKEVKKKVSFFNLAIY